LAATGITLLRVGAWADAETILRECIEIRSAIEPDQWRTWNTKSLLGHALLGQARYAEAEPLLLEGYEGLVAHEADIPQASKFRTTDAVQRLVQLYEAWGKPEQADRWRQETNRLVPSSAPPGSGQADDSPRPRQD
jgi:hypothetical protein